MSLITRACNLLEVFIQSLNLAVALNHGVECVRCGALLWLQIGILSAIPFIAMWATQLGTGLIADLIKFKSKNASLTAIRKVCVIGGEWLCYTRDTA